MQIDIKRVKIVTFAPEENIPAIREAFVMLVQELLEIMIFARRRRNQ